MRGLKDRAKEAETDYFLEILLKKKTDSISEEIFKRILTMSDIVT